MRSIHLAWSLLIPLFLITMSAHAGQPLRIGYQSPVEAGLLGVAYTHGEFSAQGFDVTLQVYPDAESGIAALRNGKIDAGAFLLPDVLAYTTPQVPVTVVSSLAQQTYSLVASNTITGWEQLNGKAIAVSANSPVSSYLHYLLQSHPAITIQEFPAVFDALSAVREGRAAAAVLDNTADADIKRTGLAIGKLPGGNNRYCGTVLVATQANLVERTELYERLVAALLQAQLFSSRTPQAAHTQAREVPGWGIAQWPVVETAWPLWTTNLPPATTKACDELCRMRNTGVRVDAEIYHRALKRLSVKYPREHAYQDWLFELGDYESLKPDCC